MTKGRRIRPPFFIDLPELWRNPASVRAHSDGGHIAGHGTQKRRMADIVHLTGPGTVAAVAAVVLCHGLFGAAQAHAQSPDNALAQRGKVLAQMHCARCHVVTPENRMTGISSTPSFMIMVTALEDWHDRFATFLARRPHPAHLRFDNEPPRPQDSPATLAEVILTQGDLEAILAYAERLAVETR